MHNRVSLQAPSAKQRKTRNSSVNRTGRHDALRGDARFPDEPQQLIRRFA